MIKQYRKKPVVIEAIQLKTGRAASITDWMGRDEDGNNIHATWDGRAFHIRTLEGVMLAEPDDYIIKGIKGEFYPCKPDIFVACYEEVPPQVMDHTIE